MKKKVCTIFFCVIIGIVSVTMIISIAKSTIKQVAAEFSTVQIVTEYDGSEDYPLKNNDDVSEQKKQTNYIIKAFNAVKNILQNGTTDNYPHRMSFVLFKKSWDKLSGLDMTVSLSANEENPVVDLGDGRLSYIVENFSEDDVNSMIEFGKQVEEKGMNFLLFCTPFKIDENDKIQSGVYEDISIEAERKYIQMVRDAGLDVVSATEAINEQGLANKELFFKTDHHWLPQTALWGNKLMCEYLNENMGFSIDTDIFNEENYNITTDKKWLGSQGKLVTEVFCDAEPFPVIVPKYDSDITAFLSKKNDTVTGRIEDVLLDWSVLEKPDIYTRRSYDFYSYGNLALISIHNNNLNDGRRVLLVKRSFADSMVPSLAACVENLDVIDLRSFDGSLQAYIDETKPDTVIAVYGVGRVAVEGSYDFR